MDAKGMPLGVDAQEPGSHAPHGYDAALVIAAQRGDRGALDALWARHRGWLVAIVLRHKPASADVEDLLQDVAAQLVSKLHTITDPGALPGWLRTTAINAARWAGRKQGVRQRAGEVRGIDAHDAAQHIAAPPTSNWAGPEASASSTHEASGVSAQTVLDLARQLPAEYAEPLLLRAVQELTYAQIGQILGLPESTIETRIARGRRMLRQAALRGSVEGVRVRG
ncbi:MAG: sigma-70 family RNA polymerase sigma factor [Phycisphaerales bacterium]|nr:sigma-70 family RNA polymerase sigma factor [Phycisphaerales bacterium]